MSLRDAHRKAQGPNSGERRSWTPFGARQARCRAGQNLAYEELANANKSLAEAKSRLKVLAGGGDSAVAELKSGFARAFLSI